MTSNMIRMGMAALMTSALMQAATAQDIKKGISLFKDGKYAEAVAEIEPIVRSNDRDAKANYYMGAAQICGNIDISEGMKRVKFAQIKGFVGDSHFYLGRAYQLTYEFEQAIQSYARFAKTSKDDKMIRQAELYTAQCEASIPLANKIFSINVIDKYRVTADSLLAVYKPSHEVGHIGRNDEFFESDIDPDGVLYITERGDAVYFSVANGAGKDKLYKIEKLLDGWGDMTALAGLESEGNDRMPVMMTDGTTLYFSSDRAGGMGGFDIYRATYDPEAGSFGQPVNMGVPFNSAFDDYLFVGDEYRKRAWFASNRHTSADSVMVYEIVWDESVIRNFAQTTEDIKRAAQLEINPELAHLRNSVRTTAGEELPDRHSVINDRKMFEFAINDTLTYTDWRHFNSPEAKATYHKAFDLRATRDSLSHEMAQKRKIFMSAPTDAERNKAVQDVLAIERKIYTIDDEVKKTENMAREQELMKIDEMVAAGEQLAFGKAATQAEPELDWHTLLDPARLEMYNADDFARAKADSAFYATLFTTEEVAELLKADSLICWGNVLTLEAVKLSEKAMHNITVETTGPDGKKIQLTPQQTAEMSELCRRGAYTLYNESLDAKYDIFDDRIEAAIAEEPTTDFAEVELHRGTAQAAFASVEGISMADGMPAYKKAASTKRGAMAEFRKGLERYQQHLDMSFRLPVRRTSPSEPVSVQEALADRPAVVLESDTTATRPGAAVGAFDAAGLDDIGATAPNIPTPEAQPSAYVGGIEPEPAPAPAQTQSDEPALVYKIQLGVFRNTPDPSKINQLPDITSAEIEGKGMKRYFSGRYTTYTEAVSHVEQARAAGFAGSFVVAFSHGTQIKLAEAQKMEQQQ